MADLFDPRPSDRAAPAAEAPRPLADRLRPRRLEDVVGQDHLLGPDGPLGAMLAERNLGSIVFWGPPGVGKTTIARLLADATDLAFVQVSAIFTGVADLRKIFEAARLRRQNGRGTLLFVDEIHRFNKRPAGRLPAADGGRHHRARRRHHREPVVRAQLGAALARARARAQPPRRGGAREAPRPRRGRARPPAAADPRRPRGADRPGRRRRPRAPQPRRAGRRRRDDARRRRAHPAADPPGGALRQVGRRALQPDLGAAQIGARLRPRRRASTGSPGC